MKPCSSIIDVLVQVFEPLKQQSLSESKK